MTETQHVSSVEDQWALLALAQLAAENAALRAQLDEQKRMTDEVDVLRNAIVRNVSHELKTPLLQIKSAVALLADPSTNVTLAISATMSVSTIFCSSRTNISTSLTEQL